MSTVDLAQLEVWFGGLLWALGRVGGLCLIAPVLGAAMIPARIRIGLVLVLTLVLSPLAPAAIDPLSAAGLATLVSQILIGAAVGFVLKMVFEAVAFGGELVGQGMSLGFAEVINPGGGGSTPVLSQFYTVLVTLLFLAMNGHLVVIEVLVESFTTLPIGQTLQAGDFHTLVLRFSWVMAAAILIGLPAITALLIVNLSFGVMMRAAPQLNIFSIGFPLTLVFGLFILWVLLSGTAEQYHLFASEALIWLREMVGAR